MVTGYNVSVSSYCPSKEAEYMVIMDAADIKKMQL